MQPTRAILFKLASVLIFVAMSSFVKAVSENVPPGEAVFFRSVFALPVILIWLVATGHFPDGLRTQNPMGHVWRGVFGVAAMTCFFTGLGLLPLPEVAAIGFATPIFVVIFAAMFLGETIRVVRMAAVAVGLVGVLIMMWPRLSVFSELSADQTAALGAIIVLVGSAVAALAQVFVRSMVHTESTSSIVFWFTITSTVLSLCTLPFGWVVPTARESAFLIGTGILGGFGQIFLTSAYRFGHAGLVAPFDYSSMLWALLIGYIFFAEIPTLPMLAGAALVIAAGVFIIWRERQLGLQRGKAKPTTTPQG
ncbi:membrane protein [Actibacterium mucosum KCTC 23349]|uniref:Membrane protein n=1 Tax=Actibacterium mucosum KCTC 23349 TaxID=1454373 RepID=A0A037ZNB2_9RHOB|nr:DMT family transporter [Actibacterium mucosum]KAJ57145.1 membrane protein [Actibacterium mucosum KCTC 23349]